jgi:hypothetical protein
MEMASAYIVRTVSGVHCCEMLSNSLSRPLPGGVSLLNLVRGSESAAEAHLISNLLISMMRNQLNDTLDVSTLHSSQQSSVPLSEHTRQVRFDRSIDSQQL